MDKCGICLKPAVQLFETGKDGVYACSKCQPLIPEITIDDGAVEITMKVEDTTPATSNDDEDNTDDKPLTCAICHKSFQKSMQLQNHLRNHRAERRFVCTYCDKAFSQSNNLRAHLRIHTNERPYKCGECGKAFTQVTNLNNHVRLHTGERPFVCPELGCNKAYAQVTNLNQHRKRHLNGRPVEITYDCNICGEQFQQRNHMYIHRRDVHMEEPKNPIRNPLRRHVCKTCDQCFPNERLLQSHAAQHAAEHKSELSTSFACVFRSCGAVLSSPHEHTEHLLSAHQLRVLTAARAAPKPRRGRPPKPRRGRPPKPRHDSPPKARQDSPESDPLAIDTQEADFQPIRIMNFSAFQFLPKIKVQSMFQ